MRTGKLDSKITGLYQVVYDSGSFTTTATSITISGLEGDTDKQYNLISYVAAESASIGDYSLRFNGDSTNGSYGTQRLQGENTSLGAERVSQGRIYIAQAGTAANIGMTNINMEATSGYVRPVISERIDQINGTQIHRLGLDGSIYNNTTNEITSISITGSLSDGAFGKDSRIILLAPSRETKMECGDLDIDGPVTGAWECIYDTTIAAATQAVNISGLEGDTDVMYKLQTNIINDAPSISTNYLQFNSDTGQNYGYQDMYGYDSTAACGRATTQTTLFLHFILAAQNATNAGEALIYAKSGKVRTIINKSPSGVSSTTVLDVTLNGQVWNNTADEITVINVTSTEATGIGSNSTIKLWRLNL